MTTTPATVAARLLDRAADLMQDRATYADRSLPITGRWERADTMHAEPTVRVAGHTLFGHVLTPGHGMPDYGRAVTEHTAGLDPTTGRAMAALLHRLASFLHDAPAGMTLHDHDPALALARTYLRETPTPTPEGTPL